MQRLSHDERLRLMKFVCSFAWTDLEVSAEERALIERMVEHGDFDLAERKQVVGWLRLPPRPEEVDPTDIPREHRQLFLDAVRAVVLADGRVVPGERDSLALFTELIGADVE